VSQIQTASACVAFGLNPSLALGAFFVGNEIVAAACASVGYIGFKVTFHRVLNLLQRPKIASRHFTLSDMH
jgi:cytosine/uracil/thiamine/allantoin permease